MSIPEVRIRLSSTTVVGRGVRSTETQPGRARRRHELVRRFPLCGSVPDQGQGPGVHRHPHPGPRNRREHRHFRRWFAAFCCVPLVNRDESSLIYLPAKRARPRHWRTPSSRFRRFWISGSGSSRSVRSGNSLPIGFTLHGLGEPREVRAGVVSGNYFGVMGLAPGSGPPARHAGRRPVGRGRCRTDESVLDDRAAPVTRRFSAKSCVWDRSERAPPRSSVFLEPSVPYPAETEIIANVVTSPHHLSATMVTGRVHRMTELFGRLAPGSTLDQARTELRSIHQVIVKDHSDAYPAKADFRIEATLLRDQITAKARTVLWVLLAASGLVFIIACSNVVNLILARTIRREGELSVRSALGASPGALRRVLLAESLLLCGTGALLGVLSARPMVAILASYASRFSVRALELTVDPVHVVGGRRARAGRCRSAGLCAASSHCHGGRRIRARQRQRAHDRRGLAASSRVRRHPDRCLVCPARRSRHPGVRSGAFSAARVTSMQRAGRRWECPPTSRGRARNSPEVRANSARRPRPPRPALHLPAPTHLAGCPSGSLRHDRPASR